MWVVLYGGDPAERGDKDNSVEIGLTIKWIRSFLFGF